MEHTFLIVFIKLIQSIRKEAERRTDKNPPRASFLDLSRYIQHAAAGRDHVIDDQNILPLHRSADEFMCDNRVLPVHDPRVIPALIKYTDVYAQNIGEQEFITIPVHIERFIDRYFHAYLNREDRREAYDIYVTDRLQTITGAGVRYADVIYGVENEEPNEEEIKNRLKSKLSASSKG